MKKLTSLMLIFLLLFGAFITLTNLLSNLTPEEQSSNRDLINSSIKSKIKALFLYNETGLFYDYDNYEALFSNNDEIALNGINVTEFVKDPKVAADYHVLIVGSSAFGWWNEPNASRANAIVGANKPVLALGAGGGTFFESLGYGYGGGSMGYSCAGMNVNATDASHELFSQKYTFSVPGNISVNGTFNRYVLGIYMANTYPDTNYLARSTNQWKHAPLAENTGFSQKMLYFGFCYAPSLQSSVHMLIQNSIEYLVGPPNQIYVLITNPANSSSLVSSNTSININFAYSGDVDLVEAELYINEAPYPLGPVTLALTGTSGSALFPNVDLSSSVIWEDGWYKLTVVVTDNANWIGHNSIFVLRDEFNSPVLTMLDPENNSEVENVTLFDIGIYADYLDYLDYYLDGNYQSRLLNTNGFYNDHYSMKHNVSDWGLGLHQLKFIAAGHPPDTAKLIINVEVIEIPQTTITTATPPSSSATPPSSSKSTISNATTSETSSIIPEESSTSEIIEPTINLSPGFTILIILATVIIIVPLKRFRK